MNDALFETVSAAYERGRRRWAVLSVLPLTVLPLGSFAVGHRLMPSVVLGVLLIAVAAGLLWRGQAFGRGLSVGLKAGVVPLVLAHAANLYGHVCTADGCTSLCVPACVLGGVLAGFIIAATAMRAPMRWQLVGSAAVTAGLIGALGCACIGFAGIAGLVLGMTTSLSVGRFWAAPAK